MSVLIMTPKDRALPLHFCFPSIWNIRKIKQSMHTSSLKEAPENRESTNGEETLKRTSVWRENVSSSPSCMFKNVFYSFVCRGEWVGECHLKPRMGKCPPKPEERIRPLEPKLQAILSQAMCTL